MKISSVDKTTHKNVDISDLLDYVPLDEDTSYSLRGAGFSLVPASFGKCKRIVLSEQYRYIHPYQDDIYEVGAGVRLADLYNYLIDKNQILLAQPSYPLVTIGGCVAGNVHGQDNSLAGCFCDQVLAIQLDDGSNKKWVSAENEPMIFDLTCGGFGVTGRIISVLIKVKKIKSDVLVVKKEVVHSFLHGLEAVRQGGAKCDYVHSWFDLNARNFRGIVKYGYFDRKSSRKARPIKSTRSLIEVVSEYLYIPIFASFLIRPINFLYFALSASRRAPYKINAYKFIFPSLKKMYYFNWHSKSGLCEYQILLPGFEDLSKFVEAFMAIRNHYRKVNITLCYAKYMNSKIRNLSFSGIGISLTIHVERSPYADNFLNELDGLSERFHCKSNLLKDSRITPITINKQYGADLDKYVENIKSINGDKPALVDSFLLEKIYQAYSFRGAG